eukprot:snap_masked-scaffold_2-processed-gene-16.21-mRNA-1 protein AED:1.00 eAED:1.00 QI:0/-1/0/0/-1/1/1/0/86
MVLMPIIDASARNSYQYERHLRNYILAEFARIITKTTRLGTMTEKYQVPEPLNAPIVVEAKQSPIHDGRRRARQFITACGYFLSLW